MKLKRIILLLSAQLICILGETTENPDTTTLGSEVTEKPSALPAATETTTGGTDASGVVESVGTTTAAIPDAAATSDAAVTPDATASQTDSPTAGHTPSTQTDTTNSTDFGDFDLFITEEMKKVLEKYNLDPQSLKELFSAGITSDNGSVTVVGDGNERPGSVEDAPSTVPENITNKFKALNAELGNIKREENKLTNNNEGIMRSDITRGEMLSLNLQKIIVTSQLEDLTKMYPDLLTVPTAPQARRNIGRSVSMASSSNNDLKKIPKDVYKNFTEGIQNLREINLKEQAIITAAENRQVLPSTASRERRVLRLEKQRIQTVLIPILKAYPSLREVLRKEERRRQQIAWQDSSNYDKFVRQSQLAYRQVSKTLRDNQRANMRQLALMNSPSSSHSNSSGPSLTETGRVRNALGLPDFVNVQGLTSGSEPLSGTVSSESSQVGTSANAFSNTGNIRNAARISRLPNRRNWTGPRRTGLLPPSVSNRRFGRFRFPLF